MVGGYIGLAGGSYSATLKSEAQDLCYFCGVPAHTLGFQLQPQPVPLFLSSPPSSAPLSYMHYR